MPQRMNKEQVPFDSGLPVHPTGNAESDIGLLYTAVRALASQLGIAMTGGNYNAGVDDKSRLSFVDQVVSYPRMYIKATEAIVAGRSVFAGGLGCYHSFSITSGGSPAYGPYPHTGLAQNSAAIGEYVEILCTPYYYDPKANFAGGTWYAMNAGLPFTGTSGAVITYKADWYAVNSKLLVYHFNSGYTCVTA